jgi:hypothetical protein
MTDKAAISGTYSDFKIIRSRKVAQLIIEVPIEQAQTLITALGLPNPASETWVAVARLQSPQEAHTEPSKDRHGSSRTQPVHRPFEELPLSQQAALACQDMEFREFLREYYEPNAMDADDAAGAVRDWCSVDSRSQILPGTDAGNAWGRLYNRFLRWKKHAKAASAQTWTLADVGVTPHGTPLENIERAKAR